MNNSDLLNKLVDDYWLNKFSLPYRNIGQKKLDGDNLNRAAFFIKSSELKQLNNLTGENDISKFIVCLSVFGLLIEKYFGYDSFLVSSVDLGIGSVTEQDKALFYLMNVKGEESLKSVIKRVKSEVESVFNHRSFDYNSLRTRFQNKGINESSLYQFGFNHSKVNNISKDLQKANFQLTLAYEPEGDLNLELWCNGNQYSEFLICQFSKHYALILTNLKAYLEKPIEEIGLVTEEEENNILENYSKTVIASNGSTLFDLLAQALDHSPDRIALQTSDSAISYKQLHHKSNQIAAYLRDKYQAGPEKLIGIITSNSEWAIIGILGILKSGSAFVPIEPSQPLERVQYILEDAKLDVLLMESDCMFDYQWFSGDIIVSDIQTDVFTYEEKSFDFERNINSLTYVIYTSGTTGRPKGVMIEDGSIVNYALWFINTFEITSGDSSILLSSLAFDLGYTSVWGTLISGGTLHLTSINYRKSPDQVLSYIKLNKITFIKTTPSFFYMLTHAPGFKDAAAQVSLRLILLGGENINKKDIEYYREYCQKTLFVNHYGPTETTIGCIANPLSSVILDDFTDSPVIGKPINNTFAYILDNTQKLCPIGIKGELYIGGSGVARGYLNNLELTDSKFTNDPFHPGKKLYRTGDFGQWSATGDIIIQGRKDNQIKVRGYRVELDEIKNVIYQHQCISDVVIVTRSVNAREVIAGYYQTTDLLEVSELRTYLQSQLPEYMIPEFLVEVDKFPLTSNGKVDTERLPSPYVSVLEVENVLPVTDTEQIILAAWQEVFGRQDISISANFFDLGGNSLLLVQVSSILEASFPKLSIVDLFNNTTIKKLADYISNKEFQPLILSDIYVLFPEEYINIDGSLNVKEYLKFQIKGEVLEDLNLIALQNQVSVWDILVSIWAYTLYEYLGQQEIPVQTLLNIDEDILLSSLVIDMEKYDDTLSLYRAVSETQMSQLSQKYLLDKKSSIDFKDKPAFAVAPIIYKKGMLKDKQELISLFDLTLEIDDSNTSLLYCVFGHGSHLNSSAIEKFANRYTNVIAGLVHNV